MHCFSLRVCTYIHILFPVDAFSEVAAKCACIHIYMHLRMYICIYTYTYVEVDLSVYMCKYLYTEIMCTSGVAGSGLVCKVSLEG